MTLICLQASRFAPRECSCLADLSCLIVNEAMPKPPLPPKPFVGTVDNMINLTAVWSLKTVGRIRSRKYKSIKYKSSLRPRLFPTSPRCGRCAVVAVPLPCIVSQNTCLFVLNGTGVWRPGAVLPRSERLAGTLCWPALPSSLLGSRWSVRPSGAACSGDQRRWESLRRLTYKHRTLLAGSSARSRGSIYSHSYFVDDYKCCAAKL